MSQEQLSEQSLSLKCYVSIATLKRAECGKPISRQTLYKLTKFFGVEAAVLTSVNTEKNGEFVTDFQPTLQPIVINWSLLSTLTDAIEYEYITYICSELHASLIKLNSDEAVNKVFSGIK